jgi:hypothetical protein
MTLENGLQIWEVLVRSGLEEVRKNHLPGYDAELVRVLKKGLYPYATYSLERELRAAPPSAEVFLEVLFNALKPFSEMLRDVLGMFEAAGARRSDENLRIAFDFDKASKALALTLKEFREVEAFFRRVVRPIVVRRWNNNTLFSLSRDVQNVLEPLGVPDAQKQFDAPSRVRDPLVRKWIEKNGKPTWLPFPGFPTSGDAELDKTLGMAEGLIHYMIAEVRKLGTTYEEFARQLGELPGEEEEEAERAAHDTEDERPRRAFVRAAHDFWPNSFAEHVCLGVEAVNDHTNEEKLESAEQLAVAIKIGFDRPRRYERNRISLEQDFRDLVNLPIWKKRHELYAVWVASRIADALHDLSFEWHPDGDTLRFPFSGAELATLLSGDGSTHIFWTEKRTALTDAGLFGRKHIQPDYRIMTVPTHRNDATTLVVECKQYRNWSRKNFGAALDDYAKGCPKAPVVLVNYGPTDSSILDLVDASRRDRTFLVGDFKPYEDAALDRFRQLVRSAYTTLLTPRITGTIELLWGPMYRDLDLHLFIQLHTSPYKSQAMHISFGSTHGSLSKEPWAQWSGDIRESPPGVERMTLSRWFNAEYDVLVHDYSGTQDFPNGEVSVRLFRVPGEAERLFMPRGGTGRWWHVCRIHGVGGRNAVDLLDIKEINRVSAECPYPLP